MLAIKKVGAATEYPVLLPTEEMNERIASFHERERLPELRDYYEPASGFSIPVPTRLPVPDPKIGQLFWPVIGAARYAHALMLMDGHTLAKLQADMLNQLEEDGVDTQDEENGTDQGEESTDNAVILVYRDSVPEDVDPVTPGVQAETPREFPMYLLAVRPLVRTGARPAAGDPVPATDDAWVLILVDIRYYWLDDTPRSQPNFLAASWSELLTTLAVNLYSGPTLTVTDTPHADYLTPTEQWTTRNLIGLSSTHLMDAAAAAIGSRIIYTPTGGLALQRSLAANKTVLTTAHTTAETDKRFASGGLLEDGDQTPGIPSNILCIFRAFDGTVPATELSPTGGGAADRRGLAWLDPTTADSPAQRAACADRWALDYFAWQLAPLDAVYSGAVLTPQSAFLDHALIYHDAQTLTTHWVRPLFGWTMLYKAANAGGDEDAGGDEPCEGHGWLTDDEALEAMASSSGAAKRVLHVKFHQGVGRCECWEAQGDNPSEAPYPWVAFYDSGTQKWLLANTLRTCCSCASLAITIPGHNTFPPAAATLTLEVACNAGNTTYEMAYQCATENAVLFAGAGPRLCTGVQPFPCDNSFYMIAECGTCDMANIECEQCTELCGPPLIKLTTANFTGGKAIYNGTRYLSFTSDCTWELVCGTTTYTITKTPTGPNATTQILLTIAGAGGTVQYDYFEPEIITGVGANTFCFAPHTLNRIGSDSESPATVGIDPEECEQCCEKCESVDWANSVAMVTNATGSCTCVSFTFSSYNTGVPGEHIIVFGIPGGSCPDNTVTLVLRCAGGRMRVDVAGSAAQSVTLVSYSFDPFIAVFDICFEGDGNDPCAGCFRVTFTAPTIPC